MAEEWRRALPAVSRVLEEPALAGVLATAPRASVVAAARQVLDELRRQDVPPESSLSVEAIAAAVVQRVHQAERPSLRRAINATGIVLHTGLGRAVLAERACRAVADVARAHSLLEIDAETGQRGSRQGHCRALLTRLTGAEAALVVNNNAAALLLSLAALAAGGDVLLSRGEMVEIGGSFRLPDLIRASGAGLVEVGTTNRTRLSDYESAITERTRAIVRCHPSNFRIVGYTEAPSIGELVDLGRRRGIPVIDDLGSGALVDTDALGAGPSPTLRQAVAAGPDLVTASGDKLLGGPQAGIVVGRGELVRQLTAHPIARAVRCDKLTLAALEATLRLYVDPDRALAEVPTLRSLARGADDIREQAVRLADALRARLAGRARVDVTQGQSQVGGGSLPGEELPTWCVRLQPADGSVDNLAAALRQGEPAVLGRIREDALLLDPRTVAADEEAELLAAVIAAVEREHDEADG